MAVRSIPKHTLVSLGSVLVGGLCAVLAISYPLAWLLSPVALGLFFYSLLTARTYKGAFLYGILFGVIAGAAGIWWFWDTLPLDWLGLAQASNQWYFVFASFAPVTLTFAIITAVFSLGFFFVRKILGAPLLLALLWTIQEIARMWGFSLLTYAERSLMGPHFSAIAFGYPFAENTYLLHLARFGGIDILDFVVALIGAFGAILFLHYKTRGRRIPTSLCISGVVLLILLALPLFDTKVAPSGPPLRVALITTNHAMNAPPTATSTYLAILNSVATATPAIDIAVLPEENQLEKIYPDKEVRTRAVTSIFKNHDILLVSSQHIPNGGGHDVTLTYETGKGEVLSTYAKEFLMPGGEYMPYLMTASFSLVPDKGLDHFYSFLPTAPATSTGVVAVPFAGHTIGALICSDILSPILYRELHTKQGADILLNVANPAWFHDSKLLFDKTVQMAKVHAVQNHAYFLQASNGAPSYAITPEGVLMAESPWNFVGTLPVDLPGS